jgi:hypothetical protein
MDKDKLLSVGNELFNIFYSDSDKQETPSQAEQNVTESVLKEIHWSPEDRCFSCDTKGDDNWNPLRIVDYEELYPKFSGEPEGKDKVTVCQNCFDSYRND